MPVTTSAVSLTTTIPIPIRGLAASGKTVFASSFAIFATGRAFEIIRNSICYPHLNVKVCASHAGVSVGEDGASHQCIEDIALMRVIPNMTVIQPADDVEARAAVRAAYAIEGPVYLRLARLASPVFIGWMSWSLASSKELMPPLPSPSATFRVNG